MGKNDHFVKADTKLPSTMTSNCKICNSTTVAQAKVTIRQKYSSLLLRCNTCGFMFIENPFWLGEAYAEPINRSDTGYVWRNLMCRDRVLSLIDSSQIDRDRVFLDYAAGYGLFVRLMRDEGYDFRWFDLYCQNLFSRGFEAPITLDGTYEAVTAFEVLEHLPDPLNEIQKIASITSVFIFSTLLVPEPVPEPKDWWYYGLEHGQHISFYSRKSLETLASRFGYQLVTDGSGFHVFSRKPIVLERPQAKPIPRWKFWARSAPIAVEKRRSLIQSDHDAMVKQVSGL